MQRYEKQNKCKDRSKNRLGGKRDRLKMKWEWDKYDQQKKHLTSSAQFLDFKLIVKKMARIYCWDLQVSNNYNGYGYFKANPDPGLKNIHITRIDAQLEIEKLLYKYLKDVVRKFEDGQ